MCGRPVIVIKASVLLWIFQIFVDFAEGLFVYMFMI